MVSGTSIIFLMILLADDIIDIKGLISEPNIEVYGDYIDTNNDLRTYIEDVRPKNVYMIEYSSWCVQELIGSLIKTQTLPNIYLLMQHPKEGESIHNQKERIWDQITNTIYQQDEFKKHSNLKILFYKQRASLRGRNFDNKLINVGWYIYKYDENGAQNVYGHNQPTITFREGYRGFSDTKKMFNDTFKNLWKHGIRLTEVCEEYENKIGSCSNPDFIKWCEDVSPKQGDREI